MANPVKPIPEGYRTITPYLVVKGAAQALDFYKRAFGAEEIVRMGGPGGAIMHAEIKIGDSMLMIADEFPGMTRGPITLGGTTVSLHLYVHDVDTSFKRAVDAGATVSQPVADMFWGDRYGKLKDPYGHEWGLSTHKQDLTPEQIDKGAKEFFAKMGKQS